MAFGPQIAVAAVVFVSAATISIAWTHEGQRRAAFEARRADFGAIAVERQERVDELEGQLADLRVELAGLVEQSGDAQLRTLEGRLARLRAAAGLVSVEGPGVVVELSDSPLAHRDDPGGLDFLIQDVDLQNVVNDLWSAGAEAIAVNEQRIIATTAIRSAGGVILVNYRVLASPYQVAAVGDPRQLRTAFESSASAVRFTRWAEIYRLGFRVTEAPSLTLPGFSGGLSLRHALPLIEEEAAP